MEGMNRRQLREHIFKLLFIGAFHDYEAMPEQIRLYFEDMEAPREDDAAYIEEKYHKITGKLGELDERINQASTGWKTSRMSRADLSILRLAVFEMVIDEEVPIKVAINEAVELGKLFGQDESPAFINGILGNIARSGIGKEE